MRCGAGLGISGGQRTNKLIGSAGWATLEHVIEIADTDEVVLVAELRASKGEVWFDADSFKIAKASNWPQIGDIDSLVLSGGPPVGDGFPPVRAAIASPRLCKIPVLG